MKVLRGNTTDYANYVEALVDASWASPVYSESHRAYYSKLQGLQDSIDGFVIVVDSSPLIGLMTDLRSPDAPLSYFGFPAPILIDMAQKHLITSDVMGTFAANLLSLLKSRDHEQKCNQFASDTIEEERLSLDIQLLTLPSIMKIVRLAKTCDLKFETMIDLTNEWKPPTKSISSAIKKADSFGIAVKARDAQSCPASELKGAFQELRQLHFQSSGRITRLESTWLQQEFDLVSGRCLLVTAYYSEQAVSSALFLLSKSGAYYGVSASSSEYRNLSLSHLVITKAISHLRMGGFNRLHLGQQFSRFQGHGDTKLQNIENFKALFGGRLVSSVELVLS